jgi:DNA primase large subunit
MEKLSFAQKFPFSNTARDYLKKIDVDLNHLPESAIKRAALMVSRASSKTVYGFNQPELSKSAQETEVIAFPIAKMFVSLMRAPNILEKFSLMIQKSVFSELIEGAQPKDLCIELADDLKIKYELMVESDFFALVPLLSYLEIYFVDDETKLVNKPLEKGSVLLTLNDFARFISEVAYARVFSSLPIDKEQIPKQLHSLSKSLESQLVVIEKKNFDLKLVGKIDPTLFPPCMSVLYSDQLAGKKLSYWARLSLASFLYQLGMSKSELMSLLAKSPDFNSKIAEYHVNRIFEKELSAPGCKKMREYALNVPACDKECSYKHPVQYYLAKLRVKNRTKNKVSQVKSSAGVD